MDIKSWFAGILSAKQHQEHRHICNMLSGVSSILLVPHVLRVQHFCHAILPSLYIMADVSNGTAVGTSTCERLHGLTH